MSTPISCDDFLGFQDAIQRMRDIDDKIIYALNTSLPTESFKGQVNCEKTCHDLYERLQNGHEQRGNLIKQCIAVSVENLKHLKNERNENPDSIEMAAKFKSEQRKLRMLQSELNVEDIVKERSYKAFNERCKLYLSTTSNLL